MALISWCVDCGAKANVEDMIPAVESLPFKHPRGAVIDYRCATHTAGGRKYQATQIRLLAAKIINEAELKHCLSITSGLEVIVWHHAYRLTGPTLGAGQANYIMAATALDGGRLCPLPEYGFVARLVQGGIELSVPGHEEKPFVLLLVSASDQVAGRQHGIDYVERELALASGASQ